ncbi:MAG TPA: amino acid racemase, partial [Gemmiger qucibialis]|nr:amino acid racemase [Gemmiger qucibialis]
VGPLATIYFADLVVKMTDAKTDQEHISMVILNHGAIPDRTDYILDHSKPNPLPVMIADAKKLQAAGCDYIVIPCNTAHYFYDRLAAALPVPVLNMPRLTAADAKAAGCHKLGILATDGTLLAETYQIACRDIGLEWAAPGEQAQKGIMSIIYDEIKQGKRVDMQLFNAAVDDLHAQGCDMAVLGCTELSLVKRDEHLGPFFIDSTEVLCKHAMRACGVEPVGFED